ncbi:hypothetical protein [Devosia geojensis]|uniref:hypothetical protein n=1 Tax=Devosia geojensis TaxID=443610 RepID=UPI0006969F2C|nr:hypothetical protein [Devosia geojensis]
MDKTVPAGAAILLDFIGQTETGKSGHEGYGVIFANKQGKLTKPLTTLTLDEVIADQVRWSKNHGSSAAGRYQFTRATLRGLMSELGLRGSQKLDANLQDRLAYHLLKRRGYEGWTAGKIGDVEFAKRLAMEWASLPVLEATQGQHRTLAAGQSFYAGDGLNKALVSPAKVREVLARARQALGSPAPTEPRPIPTVPLPEPAPSGGGAPGILIFFLIVAAALAACFIFGFRF